jgi:hypothetical protein
MSRKLIIKFYCSDDVEIGPLFPIDESSTEHSQVDPTLLTQKIIDYNNSTEATSAMVTSSKLHFLDGL